MSKLQAYEISYEWPENGFNTYSDNKLWRTCATLGVGLCFLDCVLGYFMLRRNGPFSNDVFWQQEVGEITFLMLGPALVCLYFLIFTRHAKLWNGALSISLICIALIGLGTLLGFNIGQFNNLFSSVCEFEDKECST